MEIVASPGPLLGNGPNVPSWGETADGAFTTKSAYEMICDCHQRSPHAALFKSLWKLRVLCRVQTLAWKPIMGS